MLGWIALAVTLDGALGLAGGVLPERWFERHKAEMLGFAAGALLAAALLDLLPDPGSAPWAVVGFVALALVGWLTAGREHVTYALLGSDAIHNFGDGIAIAAAFATSTHLGLVTSVAVLVHELPEEIADYAILRASHVSRRRALLWLAAVQFTAGLGAGAALLGIGAGATAPMLGIAAGTFLYIATVELLPVVLRGPIWRGVIGAALGVAAIAALS